MISYTVPGKPGSQNRNGATTFRRHGKTPEQQSFAALLAAHGMNARRRAKWETTRDPVFVILRIYFANEKPDTDSPVKAILDSLEVSRPRLGRAGAAFVANDRQVRLYTPARGVDTLNPRIEVSIFRVDEWHAYAREVAEIAAEASRVEAA